MSAQFSYLFEWNWPFGIEQMLKRILEHHFAEHPQMEHAPVVEFMTDREPLGPDCGIIIRNTDGSEYMMRITKIRDANLF